MRECHFWVRLTSRYLPRTPRREPLRLVLTLSKSMAGSMASVVHVGQVLQLPIRCFVRSMRYRSGMNGPGAPV